MRTQWMGQIWTSDVNWTFQNSWKIMGKSNLDINISSRTRMLFPSKIDLSTFELLEECNGALCNKCHLSKAMLRIYSNISAKFKSEFIIIRWSCKYNPRNSGVSRQRLMSTQFRIKSFYKVCIIKGLVIPHHSKD